MKITIKTKLYPLIAILNACYSFIDRAYIFLDTANNKITVSFEKKPNISKKDFQKVRNDFKNELLNAALRCHISKSNKKIREFIVGRALYSHIPLEDDAKFKDSFNYKEDPLGIAVSWKKKYKNNGNIEL